MDEHVISHRCQRKTCKNKIHVVRIGSKCLYLRSHFTCSIYLLVFVVCFRQSFYTMKWTLLRLYTGVSGHFHYPKNSLLFFMQLMPLLCQRQSSHIWHLSWVLHFIVNRIIQHILFCVWSPSLNSVFETHPCFISNSLWVQSGLLNSLINPHLNWCPWGLYGCPNIFWR